MRFFHGFLGNRTNSLGFDLQPEKLDGHQFLSLAH